MELPSDITVTARSLDELEITIRSARPTPYERLSRLSWPATAAAVLGSCVLAIAYAAARPRRFFIDDVAMVFMVTFSAAFAARLAAVAWEESLALLSRLLPWRPRERTLTLSSQGVRIPERREPLLHADIALISDDAEVLLASGEAVALAAGEPAEVQAWLAAQVRAARQRRTGSAEDIPSALQAVRSTRPSLQT